MNLKQAMIAVAALLASIGAERLILVNQQGHGWWTEIPGFFAFFGFFICLLLIAFAKSLGSHWLQRDDSYYESEARGD